MELKLSIEWNKLAHEAWKIRRKRKELQEQEQKLSIKLKQNILTIKKHMSRDFIFIPIERKGTISYKIIPELLEIDLELYRGEKTVIWKLEKK